MPENTTQAIFFETIMLTSVACYCILPFNTVINEAIEKNYEKNCLKTTTCNKEKKKIFDAGEFRRGVSNSPPSDHKTIAFGSCALPTELAGLIQYCGILLGIYLLHLDKCVGERSSS